MPRKRRSFCRIVAWVETAVYPDHHIHMSAEGEARPVVDGGRMAAAVPVRRATTALTILLVASGQAASSMDVANMLAQAGHVTLVATSLEDAEASLSAARIDVLLMSVPIGIDGTARRLFRRLASSRRAPPAVVMSSHRLATCIASAHAAEFIHRPGADAAIVGAVERAGARGDVVG